MHNLPIFLFVVAVILIASRTKYGRLPSILQARIRQTLAPVEDQRTLETLEGDLFEEVEIESVQDGYVILKHRMGKNKVPIALLSEDSQKKLSEVYISAGAFCDTCLLKPPASPAGSSAEKRAEEKGLSRPTLSHAP